MHNCIRRASDHAWSYGGPSENRRGRVRGERAGRRIP